MWMDFMKVAVAGKPNESFAKPNAPKKQLELPVAEPGAEPIRKAPKDDNGEPDDPDVPAKAPDAPVPQKPAVSVPAGPPQ